MTLVLIWSPVLSIKHSKNTTVKTQPAILRKPTVICYVLFYAISFKAWPTSKIEPRSFAREIADSKDQQRFSFPAIVVGPVKASGKVIFLTPEVLLIKYMLIYNPIQHKHSVAASLVITRPIHTQQAAVHAAQSWHI